MENMLFDSASAPDLMALPEADFGFSDDLDDLPNFTGDVLAGNSFNPFASIENFETFLSKRQFEPEKPYGIFDRDIAVCRFRGSKNGEAILAEIERKNEEQGMGNFKIPNTKITLINYSVCPKCKTVFSFKDLSDYYLHPKPDPTFKSPQEQYRRDTRVCCSACGEYFLPALIISDGTPKNEVQFLCRIQTADAIESFFMRQNILALTKDRKNKLVKEKRWAIRNDVSLSKLEPKPSLIANLLQYTPVDLMLNLIDDSNYAKGDTLFGTWRACR
jgi:hypothetical protein